jgi:ubiquitin-protein ligase
MSFINKRLIKEIHQLIKDQSSKPLLENDYLVHYDDENTNLIHAIIKGPQDSLYRHKFIRLDFEIPDNYPHSPPSVKFINHDSVRIHPNMYEDGKCCATILNTWGDDPLEKWTSSMGIETILVMFHSFLDNNPYMYEPGGRDDPTYSVYVLYQSWYTCLIRYLQYESIDLFKDFIVNYLMTNIDDIFSDLTKLQNEYPNNYYFTSCFEVDNYIINYTNVISQLSGYYSYINYNDEFLDEKEISSLTEEYNLQQHICEICFDTNNYPDLITTACNHNFHKICLEEHIKTNKNICPLCRTEINMETFSLSSDNWMINPITKRRIKIGGKTYKELRDNGIL